MMKNALSTPRPNVPRRPGPLVRLLSMALLALSMAALGDGIHAGDPVTITVNRQPPRYVKLGGICKATVTGADTDTCEVGSTSYTLNDTVTYDWAPISLALGFEDDGRTFVLDTSETCCYGYDVRVHDVHAGDLVDDPDASRPVELFLTTVTGMHGLEYKIGTDNYKPMPSVLTVAKGADITFKAIPDQPDCGVWPVGWPIIGGDAWAITWAQGETRGLSCTTASSSPTDFFPVNGVCGNTETYSLLVLDLSLLEIKAKRTAPLEYGESIYPITTGESFDTTSTFSFPLVHETPNPSGGVYVWPVPVKLSWEIWSSDEWPDTLLANGSGPTANFTFRNDPIFEDLGPCFVRFFFDNDTNGLSMEDADDPWVDSVSFTVREKTKDHPLSFTSSTSVSYTNAAASALCTAATGIVLAKHSASDRRAMCVFTHDALQGGADVPTITAGGHDPVKVFPDDSSPDCVYFMTASPTHHVTIVSAIWEVDAGGVRIGNGGSIGGLGVQDGGGIVIRESAAVGCVLAHEHGHNHDLEHNDATAGSGPSHLMHSHGGDQNILYLDEIDEFE